MDKLTPRLHTMPPVTLLSPYTGRPVVVREQDLGRAIRDDQGKVFYVVEDPEHGRYASMTRKGSPKDLQRYRALQSGEAPANNGSAAPKTPATSGHANAYDATGKRRRNPVGIVILLLVIALVAAGLFVYLVHPEWIGLDSQSPDSAPQQQPLDADDAEPTARTDSSSSSTGSSAVKRVLYVPTGQQGDNKTQTTAPTPALQTDAATADESEHPRLSEVPAMLPQTADEYVDRLIEEVEVSATPADEPTPIIVPTHTWRPDHGRPRVLSEGAADKPYAGFSHRASGLRYKITHKTDGTPAEAGCVLDIRYTAQTLDGKPLIEDGSQTFVLMSGQAIRAFDEGLAGVHEGEQLKLFVPRGHSDAGTLPGIERIPDEPFMLDVQLVKVRPGVTHIVEQPGDVDVDPAMPGDTLAIHYLARVEGQDEVIATTVRDGKPLSVTLGQHAVIPGLELGLVGMRPGEIRLLSIPPYLAYGDEGAAGGLIPPDAVLSFRVTLVRIERQDQGEEDQ